MKPERRRAATRFGKAVHEFRPARGTLGSYYIKLCDGIWWRREGLRFEADLSLCKKCAKKLEREER